MIRDRWAGAKVVCIASGPSLTEIDCCAVAEWRAAEPKNGPRRRVIVINTSYLLQPRADVLYAADRLWWERYEREVSAGRWPGFAGERWTLSPEANRLYGVRLVASQAGEGFVPDRIFTGGNGGYQAVQLAALFGAAHIVLLGYDMQASGRSHWHGDHPNPLGNGTAHAHWAKRLDRLALKLSCAGIKTLNASRESALTKYPRVTLEEGLA